MSDKVKDEAKSIKQFTGTFLKWLFVAGLTGVAGGLVGSAFYQSVFYATLFRQNHAWTIWLLPVGGLLIAAMYQLTRMEKKNTNAIIDAVHSGEKVPLLLVPVIFVATTITHLLGGSAGREGAALQIGGGIGNGIGKLFRLDDKDLRLVTLCGMSAVFSALFGTPLTAVLFAMEVISAGVFYYSGFVPCIMSSVTAYGIMRLFGISPTHFTIVSAPLTVNLVWRVALLAVICAIVSIVFCAVMHGSENLAEKKIPNPYLRAAAGGVLLIVLTLLLQTRDYNGAGVEVMKQALEEGKAAPEAFFWKIVFTAVTLACGFRGGEVVPTFFVGATLGCVVGPILGIPAGFAAAVGLCAVFCGAANCPIASVVLSIELFGSSELTYFAVACGISYMLSGYCGIYRSQKIPYSKLKAEFINIQAR